MKKCFRCGASIGDDARFCRMCGTLQEIPEQAKVVCVFCGNEYAFGDRFCSSCGERVGLFGKGETFYFGRYWQNGGKWASIPWRIVSCDSGYILLVSTLVLDCAPYNFRPRSMSWDVCSLRSFLNDQFINNAFGEEERECIRPTPIVTDGRHEERDDFDLDKVFIPDVGEAISWFSSDADRVCRPTDSARTRGVLADEESGCTWWLRSCGSSARYAAVVTGNGSIDRFGQVVNSAWIGVRPALWLDFAKWEEMMKERTGRT